MGSLISGSETKDWRFTGSKRTLRRSEVTRPKSPSGESPLEECLLAIISQRTTAEMMVSFAELLCNLVDR